PRDVRDPLVLRQSDRPGHVTLIVDFTRLDRDHSAADARVVVGIVPRQRGPGNVPGPVYVSPRARRRDLLGAGEVVAGAAYDCEDRKSTRLNSSHVKISYAVFCLKK